MPTHTPNLVKLSATPFHESLTLLLYGASGTGKTYFAGTAGSRNVIFNAGVGLITLQSPAFLSRYPYDPWTIEIPNDVDQPMDFVCDSLEWLVKTRRADFDIVTVEDFTAIGRYAKQKAVQINKDLGKTNTAESAKKNRGIISPTIADYGEEMNVLEWFLGDLTNIAKTENFHLICTAHERITYNKPAKIGDPPSERAIRPGFTGQTFPDKIPAFFDEVWRLQILGKGTNKKYQATTQGNEKVQAKSRHGGVFAETIDDPSWPKLIQEIQKHKYIPNPDDPNLLIKV
jgi:hypothetical protein